MKANRLRLDTCESGAFVVRMPVTSTTVPRMNLTRLTLPQRISLGAIGVVAISAFLPWVSIFGIGALGIEGDGVITLIFAIIGAAVLLLSAGAIGSKAKISGKVANIALIVLAALVALIGLIDMNGAAAIGLYLTLLAGLTWLGCAIWQMTSKTTATEVAPQ